MGCSERSGPVAATGREGMEEPDRSSPSRPSAFAVRFIETYRLRVSPGLEVRCRFEPTCSAYALESYRKYGFLRATARSLRRLSRCRDGYRGPRLDPP